MRQAPQDAYAVQDGVCPKWLCGGQQCCGYIKSDEQNNHEFHFPLLSELHRAERPVVAEHVELLPNVLWFDEADVAH